VQAAYNNSQIVNAVFLFGFIVLMKDSTEATTSFLHASFMPSGMFLVISGENFLCVCQAAPSLFCLAV